MKQCHACLAEVVAPARTVGRRETCAACGADVHVCLNCHFYAPGRNNDCNEPQAERVVDKDRGNFCDFFAFREGRPAASRGGTAREQLEKLFKKG